MMTRALWRWFVELERNLRKRRARGQRRSSKIRRKSQRRIWKTKNREIPSQKCRIPEKRRTVKWRSATQMIIHQWRDIQIVVDHHHHLHHPVELSVLIRKKTAHSEFLCHVLRQFWSSHVNLSILQVNVCSWHLTNLIQTFLCMYYYFSKFNC